MAPPPGGTGAPAGLGVSAALFPASSFSSSAGRLGLAPSPLQRWATAPSRGRRWALLMLSGQVRVQCHGPVLGENPRETIPIVTR